MAVNKLAKAVNASALLARFKGEILLGIAALLGGFWSMRLVEPLLSTALSAVNLSRALAEGLLFAIGALAALYGAAALYPVLTGLAIAFGAAWRQSLEPWMFMYIVESVIVMVIVFYIRRYYLSSGMMTPAHQQRLRAVFTAGISLGIAAVWFIVVAIVLEAVGMAVTHAVVGGVARMPYTLREFYSVLLQTSLGRLLLASVTLAVVLRVGVGFAEPIITAATHSEQLALSKLGTLLKGELSSVISARELRRNITSVASTMLSIVILPFLGLASRLTSEAAGLISASLGLGSYERVFNIVFVMMLSTLLYGSIWIILRRVSVSMAPQALGNLVRNEVASARALLRPWRRIGTRLVLAVIAGLILSVAVEVSWQLSSTGFLEPAGILRRLYTDLRAVAGLPAGTVEAAGASVEAYGRAYVAYLRNYLLTMEELARTLIKLLWGR